jgi:hypothetical protein
MSSMPPPQRRGGDGSRASSANSVSSPGSPASLKLRRPNERWARRSLGGDGTGRSVIPEASRFNHFGLWNTGCPAFAEHDSGEGETHRSRDTNLCPSSAAASSLHERRAQGVPDAGRTRRSCVQRKCTLRTQATTGQPDNRHSLRNGLRLIRGLLGAPGFWPPSPRVRHARLDPGIGGSGPHDFAVRSGAFVSRADASIAPRFPRP